MAKAQDELLEHDYDGIKEYDNPLPRWWLWLFYATIIFSAVYIPYYLLGFGPSSAEMYEQELAAAQEQYGRGAAAEAPAAAGEGAEGSGEGAAPVVEQVPDLEGDAEAVAAGKGIFTANCAPCHGQQGQGGIGPNLTDRYWIHGNTYADIVATVTNGVPQKGMVPWKNVLNPTRIGQVAAYVDSLRGTNPPDAKAPQGEEYPQ